MSFGLAREVEKYGKLGELTEERVIEHTVIVLRELEKIGEHVPPRNREEYQQFMEEVKDIVMNGEELDMCYVTARLLDMDVPLDKATEMLRRLVRSHPRASSLVAGTVECAKRMLSRLEEEEEE